MLNVCLNQVLVSGRTRYGAEHLDNINLAYVELLVPGAKTAALTYSGVFSSHSC